MKELGRAEHNIVNDPPDGPVGAATSGLGARWQSARLGSVARSSRQTAGQSPIPQLAHVGLTEREAQHHGIAVRIARLPMSAVLRTHTTDETQGFMKALIGSDDRIVGFTMIGSEAGEVMTAVQTAMLADLPYPRLRDAVIAHLTVAEGLGPLLANVPPHSAQ